MNRRSFTSNRPALPLVLAALLLAGCNSAPKRDQDYATVQAADIPPAPAGNGSIFQTGYERAWFEDIRARRVGDILTVNLVESTVGSLSTETKVDKSSSNALTNPTLLGKAFNFSLPSLYGGQLLNLGQSLESESSFAGAGETDQSNQIDGSISVMVTEVLPNGYLRVRGEKRIGLNSGNEYIKISGIVRPTDIDTNNTVVSTRIADATVVYVGDGPVANASTLGWIAKFFVSALMPF